MEVDNNVSVQVLSCTFSPKEYTSNSKAVFKSIDKDAKNYIKNFLGALYEIFSENDYTHNRFFALLLLVKATEAKNANLMKQLASARELLNLIFKDAQIDLSKPLSEKGKTLFSKKPTKDDSVVGNNYMILLLEAICFWKKAYGADNQKDPYSVMFSQLSERTQMPGSTYYVGQKLTVNDKFYLQPAKVTSIIEPPQKPAPTTSNKPAATQAQKETPGEEDVTSSEAFMQLITCVSSEEDYETQSEMIFNLVAKNDKNYDKSLLKALNEIFTKPGYTNVYKFYSLLLMVQITETGNKTFLNQLVRDNPLLNNLYKQAKDAGDLNGPIMHSEVDADDQEIPHKNQSNILILEAVKYWHTRFGDTDAEHPYANFTKLYQGLVGKVLFPEEYMYIKARGVPQRTASKAATPTDVSDPLMKLVNACIPSGDTFQAYYYEIIEYLQTDLEKTPVYLQGTLDILKSSTVDPSSKFYALYLLIKVSELIDDPNDVFISALAKNNAFMSKLFEDAQFDKQKPSEQKGTNFFTKQPNPQLSVLASNYIQMTSEILHFWGQVFETVERPDPKSIFKLISGQLKKLTMVESRVYYIGRDLGAMEGVSLTGFEFIPYKSLPEFNNYMLGGSENQLEAQEEAKGEPQVAAAVVVEKKIQQTPVVEEKKVGSSGPPATDDLDRRIANLQKLKGRLRDFYFYNEQEKPETKGLLQGLYFQISSEYADEILPNIDHIINGQHKDSEKYATIISKEGDIIDQLELDYANYIKNDITYPELSKRALIILDEKATASSQRSVVNTMQSVTSEARKKRGKEQKFYSSDLENDKDSAGLQQPQPIRGNISERIEPAAVVVMNQSQTKAEVLSSRSQQYQSRPYNNLAGQLLTDEESVPSHTSLAKVSERAERERTAQISNKPLTDRLNVHRESHHAGQLLSDNDHSMMSHMSENNPLKSKRQFNITIDPHNPTSQHSMVMTPSRNYDQDLSRLEHSIRMSKAKVKTLNGIEDSIRKSFMNTGKEPPGFKPVADMELISGLEEEITKLKDEKSDLMKENTSLKNQKATIMQEFNEKEAAQAQEIVNLRNEMAKIGEEHDEKEAAQASEIENLRNLLGEYQKRIETVQTQLEEAETAKAKLKSVSVVTPATPQQQQPENQMMTTTTKSLTQSSSTPLVATNKERQMHSPSLLDKFLTRSNYIPISPTQPMRRNDSLSPMHSQYLKTSSYGGGFPQEKSSPKMEPHYPSTITLNRGYEPNQYQQYENKKGAIANSITLSGVVNKGVVGQVKNYTELDKFVSQKPTYWYGDMELQRGGGENFNNPTDSRTFFNYVEVKSPPRDHRASRPAGFRTNLFANLKMKIEKSAAPSSLMDAFYNYKIACLHKESVLFENSAIRIDVKTGSVESQTTKENILGITLLYTNKGNDLIRDFGTDFPEVPKATLLHRPAITDAYLGGRSRTEQQVFFSFEEWPIQVPQMYGQYKIHKEKTEFDVFLPTLITQFMNFRDITDAVESFEQRFSGNNETIVVESNEITLDSLIVETSQDFNKYFDKLEYLTQQGQVLGGCFTLKWSSQSNYFLKIRVSPSNKVKFTIATSKENTNYLDILLETFTFLFGQE